VARLPRSGVASPRVGSAVCAFCLAHAAGTNTATRANRKRSHRRFRRECRSTERDRELARSNSRPPPRSRDSGDPKRSGGSSYASASRCSRRRGTTRVDTRSAMAWLRGSRVGRPRTARSVSTSLSNTDIAAIHGQEHTFDCGRNQRSRPKLRTLPGDWCNGNIAVSKTAARGSIPRSPARRRARLGHWRRSQLAHAQRV
jgi:hypothetical protein